MRLRAIVLDDAPFIRRLLWSVFEGRGYEVVTFPDPGICPLHVLLQCPCPAGTRCADVIISDVEMWEVDGIDFLEDLIQKGCGQPHFALMSGTWTEAAVARAARLKCMLFTKPFGAADVIGWLEQVERSIATERKLLEWQQLAQVLE